MFSQPAARRRAGARAFLSPMAAGLLIAALSGCGFTPLYASAGPGAGPAELGLGMVSVALIPDRPGQVLREALQQRLEGGGGGLASRFDLYVTLSISESAVGIDQQSASTRSRETGNAGWTLRAQDPGRTQLASGSAHTLDGFDLINQQFFAADLSRTAAVQRIDEALADQIAQQLAIYFKRHPPQV